MNVVTSTKRPTVGGAMDEGLRDVIEVKAFYSWSGDVALRLDDLDATWLEESCDVVVLASVGDPVSKEFVLSLGYQTVVEDTMYLAVDDSLARALEVGPVKLSKKVVGGRVVGACSHVEERT